jgi:hypothetical protein
MKLKLLFLCILCVSFSSYVKAQDFGPLIKGSSDDANYLVKGYISPLFNVVGNGLNQGWYNTAKAHKTLGFDLTITMTGVSYPSSDKTYTVDDSKMSSIKNYPHAPGVNVSVDQPTVFGGDATNKYTVINPQTGAPTGLAFGAANGTNLSKYTSFIPVPMAQLGIGLPKNTDLKIRYIPTVKLGNNGNFDLIGFGIMHDVKQYIPGVKALPFDLSVFFGYTKTTIHVDNDPTSHPDQQGDFKATATTVQGLISKKFSVLTLYGGLGYNFASSNLSVVGKYDLTNTGVLVPININMANSQSGPRFTAGLRLKFAIFTLHGDYTFQNYSAVTAGFGFSVR